MSARILYTLSDENPDLRNKTGCVNESEGCHLLRGIPIASYRHHTKLTPGLKQISTTGREPSRAMHANKEKPTSKAANKNQTVPSESSQSSVSSSWSRYSFSSADTYHRTSQPEPPFFGNGMSRETHQWRRNSHGLRDVVKDSIHREARRLMTRNTSEEEKRLSALNYIDSPRPLTRAKFMKNRVSFLDGSSQNIMVEDTPQFSYDEREMRPSSIMKLQELPRLPLDGKKQSLRSCSRQKHHLEDQHKQSRSSSFLNWQQELESHGRTSTVVAKLMGLEVLPAPDFPQRFSRTNRDKQNRITTSLKHTNSEAAKPGANIIYQQKTNSSTSKSTSRSLLKSHKKQTSSWANSNKKADAKQEDRASNPSRHRGSSCQPLNHLKKNPSLRPLEMAQVLNGHHSPISESGKKPGNNGLQKNKLGSDQQHYQALPSTGSIKTAGHQSRGQKESGSIIRNPRPKLQIPKQPKNIIDQRDRNQKPCTNSLRSESNRSVPFITNVDVTRKYKHEKVGHAYLQYTPKQKDSNPGVGEELARQDPLEIVQEQPSPVSVLDAIFHEDEPLSPVKKIKDKEHLDSEEASRNCEDQSHLSNPRGPNLSSENDPNLLLANSMPEEFVIKETAVLYEGRHKEHKFISLILSKSGILEDPESKFIITQLHPSRLPLDPDFFLALEQGDVGMEVPEDGARYNRSCQIKVSEKIKRKLIFDTVNEILAQKVVFEEGFKECIPLRVLSRKRAKGHKILQTVFSEINRLQAHNTNCKLYDNDYSLKSIFCEDLMHREQEWTDLQGEIPGIALDVERLIFKDLIGEIISSERAARKARQHRRLFST